MRVCPQACGARDAGCIAARDLLPEGGRDAASTARTER